MRTTDFKNSLYSQPSSRLANYAAWATAEGNSEPLKGPTPAPTPDGGAPPVPKGTGDNTPLEDPKKKNT